MLRLQPPVSEKLPTRKAIHLSSLRNGLNFPFFRLPRGMLICHFWDHTNNSKRQRRTRKRCGNVFIHALHQVAALIRPKCHRNQELSKRWLRLDFHGCRILMGEINFQLFSAICLTTTTTTTNLDFSAQSAQP